MLLEHRGKTPQIHSSAYIAPTATICGDVSIGENSRIHFGAIIVAEGGPVEIGAKRECAGYYPQFSVTREIFYDLSILLRFIEVHKVLPGLLFLYGRDFCL